MAGRWDEEVKRLRDQGKTRTEILDILRIRPGTYSSTIRRLDGKLDIRDRSGRIREPTARPDSNIVHQRWTESALTETWAERKARRALEK